MACEYTLLLNPLRYMANMMTLVLTVFLLAIKLADDAFDDLYAFNDYAKAKQQQQHCIHKRISKCICMHAESKEFS